MKHTMRMKWLALLLAAGVGLSGCAPMQSSASGGVSQEEPPADGPAIAVGAFDPEKTAAEVAAAWQEKWPAIEGAGESGLLLGEGKALPFDFDDDGVPELCLFYDNYMISTAVVYRLTEDGPQELGCFDSQEFYHHDLPFTVFEGEGRRVLTTLSEREGGAMAPTREQTLVFVSLLDGGLDVQTLYGLQDKSTGEVTYYDNATDGQVISHEEADRRISDYLKGTVYADTLALPMDEPPVSLTDAEELSVYLEATLAAWQIAQLEQE